MKVIDEFYGQFNRLRAPRRGTIKHIGQKLVPNQKCPCGSGKKYKKCCRNELERVARSKGTNQVTAKDLKAIAQTA